MGILSYPVYFLYFWYKTGARGMLFFNSEINNYLVQLLSLPALISTFSRPLKNEYRKDLVFFSILFGMAIKSLLIFIDVIILVLIIAFEAIIFTLYIIAPFVPLLLFLL